MKGTEKQVAWAAEILETVNAIFGDMADMFKSDHNAPQAAKDAALKNLEAQRERVNSAEDAGDIIALFRDVKRTGSPMDGASSLCAVFRVASPETDGQRKILGK